MEAWGSVEEADEADARGFLGSRNQGSRRRCTADDGPRLKTTLLVQAIQVSIPQRHRFKRQRPWVVPGAWV